jgi:amino acid transporter
LINIGSAIAFNIVIALGGLGIFTANIIVIGCMIRKRILGEPLLPSKFDLGKAGLIVNLIAITYLSLAIVLICFPEIPNPSLADMNWSIVMFAVLVVFAMGYYYLIGKDKYDGPVEYVKRQ